MNCNKTWLVLCFEYEMKKKKQLIIDRGVSTRNEEETREKSEMGIKLGQTSILLPIKVFFF